MSAISDRYRKIAAGFTTQVDNVPDDRWSSPSPCEDWSARDVVGHLIGAHNMFLGFIDKSYEPSVTVDDDPLAAWLEARDTMAAALEDPDTARAVYENPMGKSVFEESANRFVTGDVLIHTWDLARAVGSDVTLDADEVSIVLAEYKTLGDNLRSPRVFGPEVPLPDDASEQDRLIAFTGRDPRS
ncbi:MAG: TIGR03086 family metal-binding protein [Acidimicrobiia bacterium]